MLHHLAVSLRGVEALEDAGQQVQLQTSQILLKKERRRNVAFPEAFNIIPALSYNLQISLII